MSSFDEEKDPVIYLTSRDIPKEGSNVVICHNPYSHHQEYTSTILKIGQRGTVVKVGKFIKMRPEGLDLYFCQVKFNDGSSSMYFPSNLKRI